MIELITKEERKMIEYYRNHYLEDHQDSSLCSLEYLLRFWEENKKDLFRAFGNKLMVSCALPPITQSIDQIADSINKDSFRNDFFFTALREKLYRAAFCTNSYEVTEALTNAYSIANQKIDKELKFSFRDKEFSFQKGTKLTTIWRKLNGFFGIYSKEDFEKFTQHYSTFFTAKKVEGEVTFSIHPLDYMTMSDNGGNWQSCMSWANWGEYRQGTVEMMNSPYVAVAYLKKKDESYWIGSNEWNSKAWRQLFIVSPYIITSVKSYPYDNPELSKAVLNKLKEIASSLYPYSDDMVETDDEKNGEYEVNDKNTISFETNAMYNDINGNLGDRKAFGYINFDKFNDDKLRNYIYVNYSGESECMCCGSEDPIFDDYDNQGNLVCRDCCECMYCDDCGTRIYDDEYEDINGRCLCPDCADQYEWSRISNRYVRTDDCITVRIAVKHDNGEVMLTDMSLLAEDKWDVEDWADREVFKHWNGMYYIVVDENDNRLIKEISYWYSYDKLKEASFLRI